MTAEEMERAIEFLLKQRANFEARLTRTGKQIEALAKTHAEFTGFVRSNAVPL
jgi:prefoldin subunit 5